MNDAVQIDQANRESFQKMLKILSELLSDADTLRKAISKGTRNPVSKGSNTNPTKGDSLYRLNLHPNSEAYIYFNVDKNGKVVLNTAQGTTRKSSVPEAQVNEIMTSLQEAIKGGRLPEGMSLEKYNVQKGQFIATELPATPTQNLERVQDVVTKGMKNGLSFSDAVKFAAQQVQQLQSTFEQGMERHQKAIQELNNTIQRLNEFGPIVPEFIQTGNGKKANIVDNAVQNLQRLFSSAKTVQESMKNDELARQLYLFAQKAGTEAKGKIYSVRTTGPGKVDLVATQTNEVLFSIRQDDWRGVPKVTSSLNSLETSSITAMLALANEELSKYPDLESLVKDKQPQELGRILGGFYPVEQQSGKAFAEATLATLATYPSLLPKMMNTHELKDEHNLVVQETVNLEPDA